MEANKTILQMKYARIVPIFAEQTGITLEDALDFFYTLIPQHYNLIFFIST